MAKCFSIEPCYLFLLTSNETGYILELLVSSFSIYGIWKCYLIRTTPHVVEYQLYDGKVDMLNDYIIFYKDFYI